MQVETLLFNKLLIFSHLLLEMSHLAHTQARIRRRHSSIALSITPWPIGAKRPTNVASVQLRRELATGKRAAGRSLQKII